jgi:Domain of unknown function (DUF4328)
MKPNKLRSENAIKTLYAVMISTVLYMGALGYTFYILTSPEGQFTDSASADVYVIIVGLAALIFSVAYILCVVFFIMWFRRAYFNLHQLVPSSKLRYSEGWAAGAWFIPIFNLFGPYQIATDLFDKTESLLVESNLMAKERKFHTVKGWWWALWVFSAVISQIGSRMQDTLNMDTLIMGVFISILALVISIVCAYMAIKMIKNYSQMEELLKQLDSAKVTFQIKNDDLLDSGI